MIAANLFQMLVDQIRIVEIEFVDDDNAIFNETKLCNNMIVL